MFEYFSQQFGRESLGSVRHRGFEDSGDIKGIARVGREYSECVERGVGVQYRNNCAEQSRGRA